MYLDAGVIDKTLPFIKREAVSALVERSKSETDEPEIIGARLRNFYRDQYPELWASRQKDVEAVIEKIDEIYDKNFFHHMKVNWQTYPDNIGHLRSSGCFRCHDGQHVSSDGRVLPSACDVCHTFLNPVEGVAKSVAEGSFTHSVDLQIHENLRCDQCHTGGPLPSCRDCHASGAWLENYGKDKFEWNKRR
jgi:hypothetical protein